MVRSYIIGTFFLIGLTSSIAQNIVPNGGFEDYIQCPPTERAGDPYVNGYLTHWKQSHSGRMVHRECRIGDSDFWYYVATDSLFTLFGDGFPTYLTFSKNITSNIEKRAYLFAPLTEPLVRDSVYAVSYYLHFNRHYNMVDHFGATFVVDTSDLFVERDLSGLALYTEDYVGFKDTFYGPDNKWHHIQGCYTAKGGEKYIALGYFLPFDEVHFHPTYEPILAATVASVNLDEIKVTLINAIDEINQTTTACDGAVYNLPSHTSPSVVILDSTSTEVTSQQIRWPDNYTYIYYDVCHGELGNIYVESKTCFDEISQTVTLCKTDSRNIINLLDNPELHIQDEQDQEIKTFIAKEVGTVNYAINHDRYGIVGDIEFEIVECDDCSLYLPNTLDLNSTTNNEWYPMTHCNFEEYQLTIFDRWGNIVFISNNPSESWNPSNQKIESGVYISQLSYRFKHPLNLYNTTHEIQSITLIK